MSLIIVFPNNKGGVSLVYPANCGLSIEEISRKDVPIGIPYKIVDSKDLPQDHTFFDAWETDFSNPNGYGIGAEAWFAEQESK